MESAKIHLWSFWMKCLTLGLGGLDFWKRDSGGALIIASRHWRHLLCWSWLIRWERFESKDRYWGPRICAHRMSNPGTTTYTLWLWFGGLDFVRQKYRPMPSLRYSDEALA